jgi:WD40-like Beta Propeller Repeat
MPQPCRSKRRANRGGGNRSSSVGRGELPGRYRSSDSHRAGLPTERGSCSGDMLGMALGSSWSQPMVADPESFLKPGARLRWTIEIDGSSPHRLTQWRNGLEIVPSSFSPDGSVIAASEADEGESDVEYNAIALQVDGSGSSLISPDASWPSFSPDGSQIALIARLAHTEPRRGRYGFYRGAVTVMQADHTEARRLARTSFYEQSPPSWDPSGERLAYTEATTAMEINVDGSCRTKVLLGKKELLYFGPVWQPGPGREAGRIEC